MAYHNAVTDKLVVVCFLESTAYHIYSSVNQLKWFRFQGNTHKPPELDNAFFSATHVVNVNAAITLLPADYTDALHEVFKLQHGEYHKLQSLIQEDIQLVYNQTPQIEALIQQLVSPQLELDCSILLQNKPKNRAQEQLVFFWVDEVLTILAYKENKLHLANRYQAANNDELFYYLMLVVETLHLHPENLEVYTLARQEDLNVYNALFKNYLKPLKLMNDANQGDETAVVIAHYLGQCVL
jgi:hypothetical protein